MLAKLEACQGVHQTQQEICYRIVPLDIDTWRLSAADRQVEKLARPGNDYLSHHLRKPNVTVWIRQKSHE